MATQQQAAELYRAAQEAAALKPAYDRDEARMHPERSEYEPSMGAIVWIAICACFALGGPLTLICGAWLIVTVTPWTVGGTVGGALLLGLGVAATQRMLTRKEQG